MKIKYFIVIAALLSVKLSAQKITYPYYDAMELGKQARFDISAVDVVKVAAILSNYLPDSLVDITSAENTINNFRNQNPFLKNFFIGERTAQGNGTGFFSLQNALSSIGGLDVTNIADGFAKFLVKRTKQELNAAFFEKFKETISDPKYIDLQTVFPQTYRALTVIGDEIYRYDSYIQTLRETFENDLALLDKNLPSIIDNHEDFFNDNPSLAVILLSGCYIAGALEDKEHPGDIIQGFPLDDKYWSSDKMNKNWKGALQTIQLVSGSLRDTTADIDSVYWVSVTKIKELIKDDTSFQIYLGLLYQVAKKDYEGIAFEGGNTLVGVLNRLADSLPSYRSAYEQFIQRFSEKATKLNVMIKAYCKPVNDSMAFEQYYQYFKASIDLIEYSVEISKLPIIRDKIPALPSDMADYFEVAHTSGDLVLDINRRNYASAVVNAVHIYDLVRAKYNVASSLSKKDLASLKVKAEEQAKTEVATEVLKKINEDPTGSVNFSKASIDSFIKERSKLLLTQSEIKLTPRTDETYKKMYKYGSFMAAMVQAKSSEDVEKVIEATALPAGSSKIKRVSPFNVSLNAYVGLFGGVERIRGYDTGKWKINSAGITAPIGVAASWGRRVFWIPTGKSEWSTSLFVSLIDIGAVAAFRFKNDTTSLNGSDTSAVPAQVPTIQLQNILSPGIFLSIGIPKCPLSVNMGVQVGPNLRKISMNENGQTVDVKLDENKLYVRYSLSICVDIPLLNFYTKSR